MSSNALETQGVSLEWESEIIGEVVSFTGPGGSASVIDVTHLGSTRREKMMGIPDEGQISFDVNLVPGDAGQDQLRTDRAARTLGTGRLFLTDTSGTILTFEAYCLNFSIQGAVDDKIQASVTLEITGEVNWSPRLVVQTAYNTGTGILILDLEEDQFHATALNVTTTTNWVWGYGDSGLVIDTVARTSDTRATLTYTTAGGVAGDHTLTIQAGATALAGSYPSGVLSVDITIPA